MAGDDAWLRAVQQLERSTAQAEREFQDALTSSYDSYLEAMQTTQETLAWRRAS